jgi:hypothetical protein
LLCEAYFILKMKLMFSHLHFNFKIKLSQNIYHKYQIQNIYHKYQIQIIIVKYYILFYFIMKLIDSFTKPSSC